METMYNSMKGPSVFKHVSLNRFGILTQINIYRVFIYKISFPDMNVIKTGHHLGGRPG
jgi:hypothetical protein